MSAGDELARRERAARLRRQVEELKSGGRVPPDRPGAADRPAADHARADEPAADESPHDFVERRMRELKRDSDEPPGD